MDQLQPALDELGIEARAIVIPTPWDVGSVAAYLFPSDPVTLIDAGVNTPEGRTALTKGLEAYGLVPADVSRILVTHAHLDHYGGAVWLQEGSACRVYLHPADMAIADPETWKESNQELFAPLGFTEAEIADFFPGEPSMDMRAPFFTPMNDGDLFETGETRLRVEHHAGHSPGHVWVVEEKTAAIFVGDYVLEDHPTNAGMEVDRTHPTGRAPLLQQYNEGLRELHEREAPVLFPSHGPPITDHRALIDRRLAKSDRRTRHVLDGIRKVPRGTALEIGRALYGSRPEQSWEVMADVVGRLDLLVAEGRAVSVMGEDGAWHFETAFEPVH